MDDWMDGWMDEQMDWWTGVTDGGKIDGRKYGIKGWPSFYSRLKEDGWMYGCMDQV